MHAFKYLRLLEDVLPEFCILTFHWNNCEDLREKL